MASRGRVFDFRSVSLLLSVNFSIKFLLLFVIKNFREGNFKIWHLEDLYNSFVSVCAKFEKCAAKAVEGVGFLRVKDFSKKLYCQISPHGCQFHGTDFKCGEHHQICLRVLTYKFDKV